MPVTSPEIRPVNSTSYVDVAALHLGLQRLEGESAIAFRERMFRASVARRDHSLQGAINEINLDLGLQVRPGIRIAYAGPGQLLITSDIRGVRLFDDAANLDHTVPIVTADTDDVWMWRKLSAVAADLGSVPGVTATLLIEDGPAVQLVRQSNLQTILNEEIPHQETQLAHSNVLVDTCRFNKPLTGPTVSTDGVVTLPAVPAAGLTLSYQFLTTPYELVCAEGALIGLQDPDVSSAFLNGTHVIHQVREAIQEVMTIDRSYWGK